MTIQPNGKLYLLRGVKCDPDYQNTLTWANVTKQFNYFSSLAFYKFEKASDNELSYIFYGDGKIRIGLKNTSVFDCDYIMFQNPDFENKWFYAFVTGVEYVNNVTTQINFEIDVMQTWFPTISINKCFVEREHVADDTIGLHTVDEGLDHGTLDVINSGELNLTGAYGSLNDFSIVFETSFNPKNSGADYVQLYTIGNVERSTAFIAFDRANFKNAVWFVRWINYHGLSGGVVSVFLYPTVFIKDTPQKIPFIMPSASAGQEETTVFWEATIITDIKTFVQRPNINLLNNRRLKDYSPNNNKLLCYPYCFFKISNTTGKTMDIRYELINSSTDGISINYAQQLSPSAVLTGEILGYNGDTKFGYNAIPVNSTISIGYSYDTYTDFLALNKNSLASEFENKVIGILPAVAAGYTSGGGAGAANAGLGYIFNLLQWENTKSAQLADIDARPAAHVGGSGDSSYNALQSRFSLVYYAFAVRPEYAKIIDNYLSMFGYKVLREKVPETVSRQNWNYVKTVGATISGNIPADDSRKICSLLDRGITLWHNPSTMLNYSLDNPIV